MKTATLRDAIELAQEKHAGQTDKAGAPYFGHLERVMNGVEGDELKTIAILHDILEDTDVTPEYLRARGFDESVIGGVQALTKRPDEEGSDEGYFRFIHRAAQNPLARAVKIADLRDNMDLSRITEPTEKDKKRIAKYQRALQELNCKN